MIPAEELRAAAALLRERASAGEAEQPWPKRPIETTGTCDSCSETKPLVAAYDDPSGDNEPWLCAQCAAHTDYLQTWTSEVAIQLADLLDHEADLANTLATYPMFLSGHRALNLARTINRSQS